jgi:predicted membrane chloride channel (bestrophin family)
MKFVLSSLFLVCFYCYCFYNINTSTAFTPQVVSKGRSTTIATSKTTKLQIKPSRQSLKELEWTKPSDEEVDYLLKQYGEVSRYYRRDVFDAGDWVRSRRPTRFIDAALSTFKSGLLRQIAPHVFVLGFFAAMVVVYNNLWISKQLPFGLYKYLPSLRIPILPFNLASGSLGLLLTFRTNSCYQRWNEARTAWGKIINDSRSLGRMGCIFGEAYSKQQSSSNRKALLQRLGEAICSFSRSVMNRTLPTQEDSDPFLQYCRTNLRDEIYASNLYNSDHRPTRALAEISSVLVQLKLNPIYHTQIESMVSELCSAMGACERILTSPIPVFYSRHTSRFLACWLFYIPMALYDTIVGWNHFALIPIMVVLGGFMLGIEELSCQMVRY